MFASARNMRVPGGDPIAVLRKDDQGNVMFAGSDTGGFAWAPIEGWSSDGTDWTTANGRENDLYDAADMGVWDIFSRDGTYAFILTGFSNSGLNGGLWWS